MRIIRHGKFYDPFPLVIRCVCGCEYEADKGDGKTALNEHCGAYRYIWDLGTGKPDFE